MSNECSVAKGAIKLTKEEFNEMLEKLNDDNINRFSDYLKERRDICQLHLSPNQKEQST